jgi:hypothetical protein
MLQFPHVSAHFSNLSSIPELCQNNPLSCGKMVAHCGQPKNKYQGEDMTKVSMTVNVNAVSGDVEGRTLRS